MLESLRLLRVGARRKPFDVASGPRVDEGDIRLESLQLGLHVVAGAEQLGQDDRLRLPLRHEFGHPRGLLGVAARAVCGPHGLVQTREVDQEQLVGGAGFHVTNLPVRPLRGPAAGRLRPLACGLWRPGCAP